MVVGALRVIVPPPGRVAEPGNAVPGKSAPSFSMSPLSRPPVTSTTSEVPVVLWTWKETDPDVPAGADQVEGSGQTSGIPPLAEKIAEVALPTCPPPI